MIIERLGRRYWIADEAVTLGPDGMWPSINYRDLVPEGLHLARLKAEELRAKTILPNAADLLEYGRTSHPGVHEARRAADELVDVEGSVAAMEAAWTAELIALGLV